MKITIYLETHGAGMGGAEYSAAVLAAAFSKSEEVVLVHHHKELTHEKLMNCFDEDLSQVTLQYAESDLDWLRPNWKASFSKDTDCFISICHWVPPICSAAHGILYVLFPFFDRPKQWPWSAGRGIRNILRCGKYDRQWQRRMHSYQDVASISEYTRHWTKKWWNTDSTIICPPVDLEYPISRKQNRIVTLGRFCPMKRQLEMLQGLRELALSQSLGDWRMDCCGNPSNDEYYQSVRQAAEGVPVDFRVGANRSEIKSLLASGKIFWHAAGFGIDEKVLPMKLEHFGIVTVEAMAAGCVPLVVGQGGQAEIVEQGVSGFLWQSLDELQNYTCQLMKDEELRHTMSLAARKRAQQYSKQRFISEFRSLVSPEGHAAATL